MIRIATGAGIGLVLALAAPATEAAPVTIDFTGLASGANIEGLGTVHPLLNISAATGVGVAVFATQQLPVNNTVSPPLPGGRVHVANTVPGSFTNGDPGIIHGYVGPQGGFADNLAVGGANLNRGPNDFVFTFAPGWGAKSFSVTMLDFGDNDPSLATQGRVTWTAFNSLNQVVAQQFLDVGITPDLSNPARVVYDFPNGTFTPQGGSTTAMNPQIDSDASADPGEPGRYTFTLTGPSITRVAVTWSNNGRTWCSSNSDQTEGAALPSGDCPTGYTKIVADSTLPLDPKIAFTGLAFDFVTVPEPATLALLGAGLLGLGLARRRRG